MNSPGSFQNPSPNRFLTYGCIVIVLMAVAVLYCVGTFSFLVRPLLIELAAPTVSDQITLPAAKATATLIALPTGFLPATPTQAPLPTREPPTITPTLDPFVTPSATLTATPRVSATPTRRVTPTATPR